MTAPGLHGSITGLCAYSSSGALALPGFGVSGGRVKFSELCERIEASKTLWQLGMELAAKEVLCDIDFIYDARERAYARRVQLGNIAQAQTVRCLRARPDTKGKETIAIRSDIDKDSRRLNSNNRR